MIAGHVCGQNLNEACKFGFRVGAKAQKSCPNVFGNAGH